MNSKGKKRTISSSPAKRQRVWSTLSSSSATTGGESDPDDPPPVASPPIPSSFQLNYSTANQRHDPNGAGSVYGSSASGVESDHYDTDDATNRLQRRSTHSYSTTGLESDNYDTDDASPKPAPLSHVPAMYGASASIDSDDNDEQKQMSPAHMPVMYGATIDSDDTDDASLKEAARHIPAMYVATSAAESDDTDDTFPSTSGNSTVVGQVQPTYQSSDSGIEKDAPPRYGLGSKIMAKMGYKDGKGLGKHGQGITVPIAESKQKGTRGLGLQLPDVDLAAAKYDPSMEVVSAVEEVEWLDGPEEAPPPYEELLPQGIKVEERKNTIDDEDEFCDRDVLKKVLCTKTVLDKLEEKEKLRARSRANPFETIRGVFFLNRAAMKMANMDAVFDFMFTEPKDQLGEKLLGPYDILYFADVCAGPGGFSEYVLWKKGWRAKGVGFTLREKNDFKLEEFFAASNDTFEPFYGVHEDGDIYKPGNIDSLHEHVMSITAGIGVHFMMADGGFDVEGQENLQEVLSKRLYLCQCLVALRIVREGGHFVVKLFDVFTPFSAGLLYLMHRCFRQISIHKPNTSRPANSERYLICKYKRGEIEGVVKYMEHINRQLDKLSNSANDIKHIYPIEILTAPDNPFFEYLRASNNRLGNIQYVQLLKFVAFYNNPNMVEVRQGSLREECLQLWHIPDKPRQAKPVRQPSDTANTLLGSSYVQDFKQLVQLKGPLKALQAQFKNASDCFGCVIGGKTNEPTYGTQPTLFLGLGGNHVFRYERNGKWVPVTGQRGFRLGRETLVLGEIVKKFQGGRGRQTFVEVLYIIDAAVLGGEKIADRPVSERLKLCETYAQALYRRDNEVLAKEVFPLKELQLVLRGKLSTEEHKNGRKCLGYKLDDTWFLKPSGLLCIPRSRSPWCRGYSSKQQTEYYYDTNTRKSYYERDKPSGVDADFKYAYNNMGVWSWEGVKFFPDQERDESVLQFDVMHEFSVAK